LAAVSILREHLPALRVRVVNVVDLMRPQPPSEHPHGMNDYDFDSLFTRDKPVIFVFHGYPWLIHRLTYRRHNHGNLHVRGYKEEGTITTPFDMTVLNDMDRFHLAMDAVNRLPQTGARVPISSSSSRTNWSSTSDISANMAKTFPKCASGSGQRAHISMQPACQTARPFVVLQPVEWLADSDLSASPSGLHDEDESMKILNSVLRGHCSSQ
jgi:hypothetical protein